MFIRWRKRTRKGKEIVVLSAFLVESKRVNGKPRQQTLVSLGSIEEHLLTDTVALAFFWKTATQKLQTAPLDDAARQHALAHLSKFLARDSEVVGSA
jgi:hypothetical protein